MLSDAANDTQAFASQKKSLFFFSLPAILLGSAMLLMAILLALASKNSLPLRLSASIQALDEIVTDEFTPAH
ncbi:MAG: hypothetical protein A3E82_03750 [Gammaproteobacteria bacterium RIFCSPHIGHO2_12_FULL_38_11]|nr:MAG: hypothetical protein A3E82_03750 [Gammaproteobacteria bacterium RIFCSPHIGHO2_12_FULL_38_11]